MASNHPVRSEKGEGKQPVSDAITQLGFNPDSDSGIFDAEPDSDSDAQSDPGSNQEPPPEKQPMPLEITKGNAAELHERLARELSRECHVLAGKHYYKRAYAKYMSFKESVKDGDFRRAEHMAIAAQLSITHFWTKYDSIQRLYPQHRLQVQKMHYYSRCPDDRCRIASCEAVLRTKSNGVQHFSNTYRAFLEDYKNGKYETKNEVGDMRNFF